jgi:phage terminase Nu1 subunit (DNA packaging protein)
LAETMTITDVACLFRVTEKSILTWIKGGMPVEQRGKHGRGDKHRLNLEKCIKWYFENNFERLELDRSRTRLANEQAERAAIDNARRRGELMPVADAVAIGTEYATDISARLDAVAGRLANEIPSITDAATARTRVLEEHRAIRAGCAAHLAKMAAAARAHGGDAGADRTAAEEKRKRVGKREPRAAAGKLRTRPVEK